MSEELKKRFEYHNVNEDQIETMEEIRRKFIELALLIDELCPVSREKSLSLTSLETSIFYANASVARYS